MRQVIGLTCAVLCVALTAAASILGARFGGQARSLPHGRQTITLTASGASYLSPVRLREITGASMVVTDTIRMTTEPGYPQIAVWSVTSAAYDTTHRQPLEPASGTFAFDRTSAELANCCNQNINGNAGIQQGGIAGWMFPRGARKQTYAVFDSTLNQPEPFAFSGIDTVGGIQAYQFTEKVSGASAGSSPLLPADPQLYSMHRTYWVDPQTGALLKISENEDLYLVNAATGKTVTHVFRASLTTTPGTVASLVSQDTSRWDASLAAQHERLLSFGIAGGLAVLAVILFLGSTTTWLPSLGEGAR